MQNIKEYVNFLKYSLNNNYGAIKLSSIESINWSQNKLYVNNTPVLHLQTENVDFYELIIDEILIHIRLEDTDLNLNELVKRLIKGDHLNEFFKNKRCSY